MTEMIKIVAAAMEERNGQFTAQEMSRKWELLARSAIIAMRSPTLSMQDAGDEQDYICGIWRAMIDAAVTSE